MAEPTAPVPAPLPPKVEPLAWLTPRRASLALALAVTLWSGLSLKHYGITSDSPSLFYSGARHLFWMQHPTMPGALDLLVLDREPPGFNPEFQRFPDIKDPAHYPVSRASSPRSSPTCCTPGSAGWIRSTATTSDWCCCRRC